MVSEFNKVCERRKLNVMQGKVCDSFERKECDRIYFERVYNVREKKKKLK